MIPLPWAILLVYLLLDVEIHLHRTGETLLEEKPHEEFYQEQNPTYYL